MRDLAESDKNEISVFDISTQQKVTYYHKTIKTDDHLAFNSLTFKKAQETTNITEIQQAQIDFLLNYITGFEEDYFCINGKPISSDKDNKNYNPGWKGILRDAVGDQLLSIMEILFSKSNYILKKNSPLMMNSKSGTMPGQKKKGKNT